MKPVMQTIYDGVSGNCFAACVASVLEMQLEELPNPKNEDWWNVWRKTFAQLGVGWMFVDLPLPPSFHLRNGIYVLLAGKSPRAVRTGADYLHSIVAQYRLVDGKHAFDYRHDPLPASQKESADEWFVGDPVEMMMLWKLQ